jgi:deoxyribose-phosphate aldolase
MVCAVVGFPLGAMAPTAKAFEAREAVRAGAEEIDMVINQGALKSRDYAVVHEDIQRVVEASRPAKVKVILETGALTQEEKIVAISLSKVAGAHFVKTSTGFGPGGATAEDIALMRKLVGSEMGVKASGGVRTCEDAQKMKAAGASRIGASASVAIVKGCAQAAATPKADATPKHPDRPWLRRTAPAPTPTRPGGSAWGRQAVKLLGSTIMTTLPSAPFERVVLIVLDSCGCGSAPDAARYGDTGANTLGHIAERLGGLQLPHLESLGLGNVTPMAGLSQVAAPRGGFGRMRERSLGKDTTTGHWELAGLDVQHEFPTFPQGFPAEMMARFTSADRAGRARQQAGLGNGDPRRAGTCAPRAPAA